VFHLVLGLAVHDVQCLLWQLNTALPGVSVVVLEHDLDNVVNLDINCITNDVVQNLGNTMLIVLLLMNLAHVTTSALRGHMLGQVNRLLQLKFL